MGIGGGAILIPCLMFFLDTPLKEAQSINMTYFIPTAVSALITHKKQGNIETKILKPIIILGVIGAAIGAFLANSLNNEILEKIFGGFLLLMGVYEFFKKN